MRKEHACDATLPGIDIAVMVETVAIVEATFIQYLPYLGEAVC